MVFMFVQRELLGWKEFIGLISCPLYSVIVKPSKDNLRNMKSYLWQLQPLGFCLLLHLLRCGACGACHGHVSYSGWWVTSLFPRRPFGFPRLFALRGNRFLFSLFLLSALHVPLLSFNFLITQVRLFYFLFSFFEKFISSFFAWWLIILKLETFLLLFHSFLLT